MTGHAVKSPEDYQDSDKLYNALIARIRKYHPSTDISMIEKAYKIAKEAHERQGKSGEACVTSSDMGWIDSCRFGIR